MYKLEITQFLKMNIITTKIITASKDELWDSLPEYVNVLPQKPVLVITNNMEVGGAEHELLLKLIAGCELTPQQYHHIMLTDGEYMSWAQLHYRLNPFIVLLFGVLPSRLGVSALFKINEPNHYDGSIWLPTLSVKDVFSDTIFKKQLWADGLKPLIKDKVAGEIVCPATEVKW